MPADFYAFGEILWDCLPSGRYAGGAPFNVAAHLAQIGVSSGLISSVGQDSLGPSDAALARRDHRGDAFGMSSIEADEHGLIVACPSCAQRNRMRWEGLGQTFRCPKCQTELSPPREPVDVTSERMFNNLTSRSAVPVLVDFWAPWCGPCRMVAPEFDKVALEGAGRWLVAKVNTEELQSLSAAHRVTAIPTMALFQGGRELGRQQGAMPAPRIRQFIESNIGR